MQFLPPELFDQMDGQHVLMFPLPLAPSSHPLLAPGAHFWVGLLGLTHTLLV